MNLEEIKNKIRTTNPEITEELLDLLYEYVLVRLKSYYKYDTTILELANDKEFEELIQRITLNL